MNTAELKKRIYDCGVVGAGGAGFPTHVKLSGQADTVILNGAECEPLLRVDRQLLANYTKKILGGLDQTIRTIGAKRGIVAIKEVYRAAIESVQGSIGHYPMLELQTLPDIYPSGDEVNLIYETTKRVVPEGSIPIEVGVMVLNVETVLNIYEAIQENQPVTHTYVTIAGAVQEAATRKVPIGISVEALIRSAGGSVLKEYVVLMGGPMTGRVVGAKEPVTKTTKAVIVLPKDHPVVQKKQTNTAIDLKRAMSACSQCRMCTDLCPRNLLGHSIVPNRFMNSIANGVVSDLESYMMTLLCCECGVCEMYACHQGLSPRRLIAECKAKLRQKGVSIEKKPLTRPAHGMRSMRQVPMERLIDRLGLREYNVEAPLTDEVIRPDTVKIPLRQHIGAPGKPVVQIGSPIQAGQLIAEPAEGQLGAKIHASMAGFVTDIDNAYITIKNRGEQNG